MNLQPAMSLAELYSLTNRTFASLTFTDEPEGLFQPLDYCIKNGGKRIRPVLTLLSAHVFGAPVEKAINPAIGLELFHNFTLIHDDIMDNAPIRRGQPTVFTKWNTNTAILSGDALFAIAGEYMTRVDDIHLRPVLETFYKTVIDVCKGQQYDMDFEKQPLVSIEDYLEMIRLKTAVLPAACLKVGGIVASASEKNLQLIYEYGEHIGIAFQIRDDLLDVYGDTAKFGKMSGGDILAGKKTWLYLTALSLADKKQRQQLTEAYNGIISNNDERIAIVKRIFDELNIEHLARKKAEAYYQAAMLKVNEIDAPADRKNLLIEIAGQLLSREV